MRDHPNHAWGDSVQARARDRERCQRRAADLQPDVGAGRRRHASGPGRGELGECEILRAYCGRGAVIVLPPGVKSINVTVSGLVWGPETSVRALFRFIANESKVHAAGINIAAYWTSAGSVCPNVGSPLMDGLANTVFGLGIPAAIGEDGRSDQNLRREKRPGTPRAGWTSWTSRTSWTGEAV